MLTLVCSVGSLALKNQTTNKPTMKMSGWIKIHRKIKDHWLFTERRVYSKFEAWHYILLSCAYEDRKVITGTHLVDVKRGQLLTTEALLMNRFQWSKSKLRKFLQILIDDEMVIKESDRKKTVLTVVKYEDYQVQEQITKEPLKTKKEPNKNNIDQRKEKFKHDLSPFEISHGKEMVQRFFDYWSEYNKSGTKMKWEMQETFQLALRLNTWQKNDKRFNKTPIQQPHGSKKPNTDDLLDQQRHSILERLDAETGSNGTGDNSNGFESHFTYHEEID